MINSRQFYISKYKSDKFPTWEHLSLDNGFSIHYQPDLNIIYRSNSIALLGHAWQTDPLRESPKAQLAELNQKQEITHQDVYEIEKTWCGRYLLIVQDWVYLDACGLINIFYSNDTISSSLNVLCSVEGRKVVLPPIEHRKSPDFVPGMRTTYPDVHRLMPSQILSITNKHWKLRPLLVDEIPNYNSDEESITRLSRYFIHSVQNLAQEFKDRDIWVASTAGRDSRASIALLHKAGVSFSTFTLWHHNISKADCAIPKRIAKAIGINYRFVKRKESNFSKERHDSYLTHTAGMAVDEDWRFYAYNQYPSLKKGDKPIVILRSGIWGIANEYYARKCGERGKDIKYIYSGILKDENLYQSTMEWEEFVKNDPLNQNVNFVDRIYWELREGCWLASIEQSFDVMDGIDSIQLFNCRLLIRLLLGFSMEDRMHKDEENKIAFTNCPILETVPYDYQFDAQFSQRLRRKINKVYNKIYNKIRNRIKRL